LLLCQAFSVEFAQFEHSKPKSIIESV